MRRYAAVVAALMIAMLVIFVVVSVLDPAVLSDPYAALRVDGVLAALIGVGLLIADVVLPVPSSLIMFADGVLFGWLAGALVSTLGSVGAALVGFWLGRRGESVLTRYVSPTERERANRLLGRWGMVAVILTRPVPILAETTAIMAGLSPMRWRSMIIASALGVIPTATLYALAGATAAQWDSPWLILALTVVVASGCWLVGRIHWPIRRSRGARDGRASAVSRRPAG